VINFRPFLTLPYLVFRAVAFYDARRWGVIDNKSQGGARAGAVILSFSGTNTVINTNAFINYNYLSYSMCRQMNWNSIILLRGVHRW
jgi:hypothetical protein